MKALIIVASILLPLLVLLFGPVRFSLIFDGRLRLRLSYLFLRISLYPQQAKKKKKRPKANKRNKKHKKSQSSSTEAVTDAKKREEKPKEEKQKLSFSDIRFLLRVLRELVGSILNHARKHIRLYVRRLRITIGGEEDAARAAIEYGLLTQSVSYLIAALDSTGFLKKNGVRETSVNVDYLESKHSLEARIDVVCPLLFLLAFAFRALAAALAAKGRWTRHRAKNKRRSQSTSSEKEIHNG